MKLKRSWISFGLYIVIFVNSIPTAGQTTTAVNPKLENLKVSGSFDPVEVFREFSKSADDGIFSDRFKKLTGEKDAEEAEKRFAASRENLFEMMRSASADNEAILSVKTDEIIKNNFGLLKESPPIAGPKAVRNAPRRRGPSPEFDDFAVVPGLESKVSNNSSSNDRKFYAAEAFDDPVITRVETDTGVAISGSAGETIETTAGTATQSGKAESKVNFDGKSTSWSNSVVDRTEAVSKLTGEKVTKTSRIEWGSELDLCPDVNGLLHGRMRAAISVQTTLNTGKEIVAPANNFELDFKVTGFVNDDAVMTHFKLEGAAVNTLTGYTRARSRKMIEIPDEFSDGTRRINFRADEGTPPKEINKPDGGTKNITGEVGQITPVSTDAQTASQVDQIASFAGWGIQSGFIPLNTTMKNSIFAWRNGKCVEVDCTAPKNALEPGETVKVTAVSVSKQDLSKFSARLEGVGDATVTPARQIGAPSADYALTATGDGTASITVTSTSRRGIGAGMLEFGKSVLDDEDICDGNWHGTIEIRKTHEDIYKKTTKPGDSSASPRLSGWQETVNRNKYEGKVKILEPKVNTATVSHSNASFTAGAERLFLNHGFFTEPNECGAFIKKTIKTESGTENRESGTGEGKTDATLQVYGGNYSVNLIIPEFTGTFQNRSWHRPSGYCQEGNNLAKNTDQNGETRFDRMGISFDGVVDPRQPDVLVGTKTITSDDGKEVTVIKWRIRKCLPGKVRFRSKVKNRR